MTAPPLPADILKESLLRWAVLAGIAAVDTVWIVLGDFHVADRPLLALVGELLLLRLRAWCFVCGHEFRNLGAGNRSLTRSTTHRYPITIVFGAKIRRGETSNKFPKLTIKTGPKRSDPR